MAGRPPTETQAPLGAAIRAARAKAKISADDAAARAGLSRATWYQYEQGRIVDPPIGTLLRIAAALKISLGKLLN